MMSSTLICFPQMNAGGWPGGLVDGALFFDPGLSEGEGLFRPDSLPMDSRTARRALNEFLTFGEQFTSARELGAYRAATDAEKKAPTSREIRNELLARMGGSKTGGQEPDPLMAAQLTLLLAWNHSVKVSELDGLGERLTSSWDRFGDKLGMDGEDVDEETVRLSKTLADLGVPDLSEQFPWQKILLAMAPFLPEGTTLLTMDKDAAEAWREAGLMDAQETGSGVLQGARVFSAPLYRLAGLARAGERAPWLARAVRVALLG